MQKWRTYYNSIPRPEKQKIRNDESGITLVELLAAISILSIVILLAGSVHMFGQRQFIEQTKSASQANDLSHAMSVMSKDLRKKEIGKIEVELHKIKEADGSDTIDIFSIENEQLKKGDTVLVDKVSGEFTSVDKGDGVHIRIENLAGVRPAKKYETTIYFRRTANIEE